jgi:hypothetical protein
MSFDAAAVATLFDRVESHAMTLAIFETVNTHEPKVAPGGGLRCAIWVQDIRGVGAASGLSATSGVVTLNIRIYGNFLQQPLDGIDPAMLTATTTLLGAFTGDFELGATVRNIDLLGQFGTPMSAVAGYLTQDSRVYRVMTINLPIVLNDLWTQEA